MHYSKFRNQAQDIVRRKCISLLQLKCADCGSRSDGLRLGTNQVVINSCPAKKTTGARGKKKSCTKLAPDHLTSCTWDNYTQLDHLFYNHFDNHTQSALFLTNYLCHFLLWLFVTIHKIWQLGQLCWNNYTQPCTALKRQTGQHLGVGKCLKREITCIVGVMGSSIWRCSCFGVVNYSI